MMRARAVAAGLSCPYCGHYDARGTLEVLGPIALENVEDWTYSSRYRPQCPECGERVMFVALTPLQARWVSKHANWDSLVKEEGTDA